MAGDIALKGEVILKGPEYTCVLYAHKKRLTLNMPHMQALRTLRRQTAISSEQEKFLAACLDQTDVELAIAVQHSPVLILGPNHVPQSKLKLRFYKWLGIPEGGRLIWKNLITFWKTWF